MHVLRGLFIGLNIILSVMTVGSVFAPHVDPSVFSYLAPFGLIFPWLILANILVFLVWAMMLDKMLLLPLLTLAISGRSAANLVQWHAQDESQFYNSNNLIVSSFNTQELSKIRYAKKEDVPKFKEELAEYLKEIKNTDILFAQEVNQLCLDWIQVTLPFQYIYKEKEKWTAIFSKYKILDSGLFDFGTKVNSCLWADLQTPAGIIRVYNVHLQSNQFDRDDINFIDKAQYEGEETVKSAATLLDKYRHNTIKRSLQAQQIKKHMDESPYPIIVGGDFNDPSQTYTYHALREHLQDSYIEKGRGLGLTYQGVFPDLRIDYILGSDDVNILGHRIVQGDVSDHNVIQAAIQLKTREDTK